jgi:O-methyltransferase
LVRPYTMTTIERVSALRQAVEYVVANKIAGDLVECGVWKGGSMMAAALTLKSLGVNDRKLHLFDTFEGMTEPSAVDVDFRGRDAKFLLEQMRDTKATTNIWAIAQLEGVKALMESTGYESQNISYVKGRVEETLPVSAPDKIAILRLDTDWYESTLHELNHLYPRLSRGGVLIIDDYGHWQGARRAVDEYIAENKLRLLLNRIDYTGRICVKLDA